MEIVSKTTIWKLIYLHSAISSFIFVYISNNFQRSQALVLPLPHILHHNCFAR